MSWTGSAAELARLAAGLAAALGVLWGGVWALARLRGTLAERRFPPQGQFVTVGGRRMHAVVLGHGPDLVLIHGASGNCRDLLLSPLAELAREFRLIVPDRPGFGHSDPLPAESDTIFTQAEVLADVAEALGARRPLVLGHSLGGAVALAWALQRPDRVAALVTVSAPSHPWPDPPPLLHRLTAPALGAALLLPLIAAFVPRAYVRNQIAQIFPPQQMPRGYARTVGAGLTLRPKTMRTNARERLTLAAEVRAMQPQYRDLALPFELVHGDADPIVGFDWHARRMAREAPGVHVTRLPGIGHMPHHVAAEAVLAATRRAARRAGMVSGPASA